MNNDNFSLRNLFTNLTGKQKLAAVVILIIVAIVGVIISGAINSVQSNLDGGLATTEATNLDDGSSINVPVSTEYDENFGYPLDDYLPKASFTYKYYGDNESGTRTYWVINENTAVDRGVVISVDSCDVEGNTKAALEYLKSLPVNLGGYSVVYQTHVGEVPCDVE